jgi:deazaflavin-dependent oxidoreductase (nitroreductase family)
MTKTAIGWWPRFVARRGRGVEWLYRWHVGWLFGHRLAVVTRVDRHSGKTYRTVLYVQRCDPHTDAATVVSAWGESDWLRNIRAERASRVEIGRRRYVPQQRFLRTDEIVDVERIFRREHPWLARG